MPDQPKTVKREVERPRWVRRAFIGVVIIAAIAGIIWWRFSDDEITKDPAAGSGEAAAARAPEEVWIGYTFQTDEEYRANVEKNLTQRAEGLCRVYLDKRDNLDFATCFYGPNQSLSVAIDIEGKIARYLQDGSGGELELIWETPGVEYRWRWEDDKGQTGTTVLRKEFR